MRVLLASSSSGSRGGGEIFLRYLGQGLAQRGHEVIFWCAQHSRMDELVSSLSRIGRVVRSSYRNLYDHKSRVVSTSLNFATSRRLASEWVQLQPNVLHVNKQNLEDGLDLLRAANMASIPSLCTIHITQTAQYLGARFSWLRDALSRRCLLGFKGPFISVQETRRRELSSFLQNGKETKTIFNGVPIMQNDFLGRSAKRKELGLTDQNVLVLGLGRMEAQKRPLLFLQLAQRLHEQVPAAKFLWIGGGSFADQWDQWVTQHKLEKTIWRMEWQNEVKPFLFATDLFLHTAAYEGLPIALTEAMMANLPCAIPDYLIGEVSFFSKRVFVPIEEKAALAQLVSDPIERKARGDRSRQLAVDNFSIEKMAANYEQVYNSLHGCASG
jgi:glycosyltransferase involved in cell wall biosynthesis